jgi:hypothetical protein
MKRFGKLHNKSMAIGIGAGRELILFYLANHLGHVYATDLYSKKRWEFCAGGIAIMATEYIINKKNPS